MIKRLMLIACLLATPGYAQFLNNTGSGGGGGTGTVSSVSVTTQNGVSAVVTNPTTAPALAFTLGAITPSSAAIGPGSAITSSGPGGALSSGAFSAAAPCTAFGTAAGTCAQGGIITAGGPTGSATAAPVMTYNAAGQLTAVTTATITPAVGSVTGLGTNVATALGNTAGSAGGFALFSSTPPQTIGSWTPIDSSGAGLTFTSVSSGYTKLGNMVFAYASLTYPTTVDATSAVIGGLPTTVANAVYARQCFISASTLSVATVSYIVAIQNTTTIAPFSAGASTQSTNSQMSGGTIRFECIYPAT